jgi:hypothetical protein
VTKSFSYNLSPVETASFFMPIRTKKDFLTCKIKILNYLCFAKILNNPIQSLDRLEVRVDKMSRVFLVSNKKFVSFHFPFVVEEDECGLVFTTYSGVEVESKSLSFLEYLITKCDILSENDPESFFIRFINDAYDEGFDVDPQVIWVLTKELLLTEECYLRYDVDTANFKEKRPKLHPVYHLDVCYSSGGTFKIGLSNEWTVDEFVDFLSVSTDCKFLDS